MAEPTPRFKHDKDLKADILALQRACLLLLDVRYGAQMKFGVAEKVY